MIEFISNCDTAGTEGLVLSIDYSKAFDTLSINFMKECYKFFSFGDYFINMLDTVGKNRTSSIILDNRAHSESFLLETGRPQGENLSPSQYNIGNQIMLFKLELDSNLKSVFQHFLIPRWQFQPPGINNPGNAKFVCESDRQTGKVEGLADDTTALGKMSSENVAYLGKVLDDFAIISRLRCNFDKTLLVPVGKKPPPGAIVPGKFTISTQFTLLGMKIDSNLNLLHANFDTVIDKIVKSVNFFKTFR